LDQWDQKKPNAELPHWVFSWRVDQGDWIAKFIPMASSRELVEKRQEL
jgi:hypothetical protein